MTLSAVVPDIAFSGTSGSGTMGPFSLVKSGTPLVFYSNSEVVVLRYDSVTDTTPTLLTEGTHYTLTGGPTAGSITLISPSTGLLTAERLYVTTVSALAQGLDLTNGGNFSSSSLEQRLDKIYQILQQQSRDIKSSIRFAMFDTDEIPRTTPLGAVIDKVPYVTGTASSPSVGYLDAEVLNDLSDLSDANLANIAIVAADLSGADTIGLVGAAIDDVETVAGELPAIIEVAEAIVDGTITITKDTYAALTAIPAEDRTNGMLAYVKARAANGDGGERQWRFDSASSAPANDYDVLAPDAGTGRWLADAIYNKVVRTKTALKALDPTVVKSATLASNSWLENGTYHWRTGDFTALIAADTYGAYYLKADSVSASVGAYVREENPSVVGVRPELFGSIPDDPTAASGNLTAFGLAASFLQAIGGGLFDLGSAVRYLSARWTVSTDKRFVLKGASKLGCQLIFTGSTGGIGITNTTAGTPNLNHHRYVETDGFSLLAAAAVASSALDINIQNFWAPDEKTVRIGQVHVSSLGDMNTQHFNDGLIVRGRAAGLTAEGFSVRGTAAHIAHGFRLIGDTASSGAFPIFGPTLDDFQIYGVGKGVHATGWVENLVIGSRFEVLANTFAFDLDGSASSVIAMFGVRNPVLSIGAGHANGDVNAFRIKSWDAVTILGANPYHGVSAGVGQGGCYYFENIKGLKLTSSSTANAPQSVGTEQAITMYNVEGAFIDAIDLAVFPDAAHNSAGIFIATTCKDIFVGPGVRIKSNNSTRMTYGIFCQTGNGSGVEDELRVIHSKIADAVYPIFTVNAKRHTYKDLAIKNCTNPISDGGTPANVTSSGHVTW